MNGTLALVAFAASVCAAAMVEAYWYRRQLLKIPFRIHVNGTRGKSSVTRLIAAGLRSGGIRTCAKTTGTLARMILPDGKELPIFRPDRANVIEQKRIVQTAVGHQADALVIECMALQPLLQSVCELKLVRSTHGVITNARADHLDVMGPTRLDVARALSATTPIAGNMFTAEDREDSLSVMKEACVDRGSELIVTTANDASDITQDELAQFSYLEHAENVALALKVCQSMGVAREVALKGMWEAQPDPGAMRVHVQAVHGNAWHFVNAFAANDPESTTRIWDSAYDYFPGVTQRVLVMNCRVDRADRSTTMAEAVAAWAPADRYVIIGSGTDIFLRPLLKRGIHPDKVLCLGNASGPELVESVLESFRREERVAIGSQPHFPNGTTVAERAEELESSTMMLMGIGNVAGPGMALADHFGQDQGWERFRAPATRPARVMEMV